MTNERLDELVKAYLRLELRNKTVELRNKKKESELLNQILTEAGHAISRAKGILR